MKAAGGPGRRRESYELVPSTAIGGQGGQLGPGRRWAAARRLGVLEARW